MERLEEFLGKLGINILAAFLFVVALFISLFGLPLGISASKILFSFIFLVVWIASLAGFLWYVMLSTLKLKNGLLFGAIASIVVPTLFTILLTNSVAEELGRVEMGLVVLLTIILIVVLFISQLRTMLPLRAGIPIVFGKRLDGISFEEGLFWWPKFFELVTMDMSDQVLDVEFSQDPIVLPDLTKIENANINAIYSIDDLFKVSQIGFGIKDQLREIISDRIRNAMLLLADSYTDEEIKDRFKNYPAMAIAGGLKDLRRLALWGVYFPSHQEYPELLQDEKYAEELRARNINFNSFTTERAASEKIPTIGKERYETLVQKIGEYNIPKRGIRQAFQEFGFVVKMLTITSFQVPDEVQAVIDAEKREHAEKLQELQDIATFNELIEAIKKANPDMSTQDALDYVLLRLNKSNIKAIKVIGKGGDLNKIAAALFSKGGDE